MTNLRTHKCLGVEARNNCDHNNARSHLRYPRVILASKLSIIIFIGLCAVSSFIKTNRPDFYSILYFIYSL